MRMTREFFIPSPNANAIKQVIEDIPGSEVYRYEVNGTPYAMAFGGKRSKPDFHFRFQDDSSRENRIRMWAESQKERAKSMKEHRARQNAPHEFKVGQLFYCSWGYDQTNINYYELVELKGKCMGKIVPIYSRTVSSNPPQDMVGPSPGSVREWDVLLGEGAKDGKWKKLTKHGFSMGRGYSASPCDAETSRYETSSGWGH